jgi:hypothetical protein
MLRFMDDIPLYPIDPNTIKPCRVYWDNEGEISCQDVINGFQVTLSEFRYWVRFQG